MKAVYQMVQINNLILNTILRFIIHIYRNTGENKKLEWHMKKETIDEELTKLRSDIYKMQKEIDELDET